jgi:hypothetical protein
MIGERMEMPFETVKVRRPSPTGIGRIVVQHVDLPTITQEMAVPTEAIARRAIEQGLPIDPAGQQADGQDSNRRKGYL